MEKVNIASYEFERYSQITFEMCQDLCAAMNQVVKRLVSDKVKDSDELEDDVIALNEHNPNVLNDLY